MTHIPYLSLLIKVGLSMMLSLFSFIGLGLASIYYAHLPPAFLIIFVLIGLAVGFWCMYKVLSHDHS
ncbi:MAG: AtpZ/AtpI family protein [Candidatus Margulisbacteria bacterium]|nr:AtpZ/AtpI family protein [Candidatus Margulisiibacteriota bacterium]